MKYKHLSVSAQASPCRKKPECLTAGLVINNELYMTWKRPILTNSNSDKFHSPVSPFLLQDPHVYSKVGNYPIPQVFSVLFICLFVGLRLPNSPKGKEVLCIVNPLCPNN